MASSYVFPPPDGSHYQGRYVSQLAPARSALSNGHSNGNPNGNGNGSTLAVKTAMANGTAPGTGSLFTHAEVSQENTPQASPNTERDQRDLTSDYNRFAVEASSRHTHTHEHHHEQRREPHHNHSHSHEAHHNHPHAHEPQHSHAHSRSHTPMKARQRGESDLGRPASSTYQHVMGSIPAASSSWFSLPEALTSLLIPLPYMLASAAYLKQDGFEDDGMPPLSAYAKLQKSVLEEHPHHSHGLERIGYGFIEACTLTTGTLLLVGMIAKMRSSERMLDRRKDKAVAPRHSDSVFALTSWAKMVTRSLSVGLPFYAATQIGGMRTGLVLLVAIASNITNSDTALRPSMSAWTRTLRTRTFSLFVVVLAALLDFSGITFRAAFSDLTTGYLALACSLLLLPTPLPTIAASSSPSTAETPVATSRSSWSLAAASPLVSCPADGNITLAAGILMAILTVLSSGFLQASPPITPTAIVFSTLSIASSVAAVFFARPSSLRSQYKAGLGLGCFLLACCAFLFSPSLWPGTICNGGISALSYVGVLYDTSSGSAHRDHDDHVHDHAHNARTHSHSVDATHSMFTGYLMSSCKPGSLAHGILSEKDSRRIAYFTCLNFAFMLVQGVYGYLSGSLGLLSDTVHMFFDCLGLVVGLGAAVASKWPTSPEKPYGWGKLNTLSGFGNGIFLMLVSVEFAWEALEGIREQTQIRHVEELLVVSTLGFAVNMVGLFAFGHAHHGHDHGHSHGGDSHDHDHSHATHDHSHDHSHSHSHAHNHGHSHHPSVASIASNVSHASHGSNGTITSKHDHSHSAHIPAMSNGDIHGFADGHKHEAKASSHNHAHDHHNENMHGIFLHVAADAGGSAAVIISTALTLWKPWYLWDPLATILIAGLIFAAAVPLVTASARKLLLVIPEDLEYNIKNTLQELGELRGVVGYAVPRFWLDDRDDAPDPHGHGHDHGASCGKTKVMGVIHIIAAPAADLDDVRHRVDESVKERGMDLVVQVEREGAAGIDPAIE